MSGNGGSSTGGRYVSATTARTQNFEVPPVLGCAVATTAYVLSCTTVTVRDVNGRKVQPPWYWRNYSMMRGYKYHYGTSPAMIGRTVWGWTALYFFCRALIW